MKASTGSNVASPQALAISALATRYLLETLEASPLTKNGYLFSV